MTVFYFTGTGNSLFVARKVADEVGAELISIPQVIAEKRNYIDDSIGFVYPQYADGLPKMVRSFIQNNTFNADYFFAVDLYAFIRLNALGEIAGLIPLNYGVYLKTPNNFIFLLNSPKNPSVILAKAEKKLEQIINDITNRKTRKINPRKSVGNATKYFGGSKFKTTAACTKCGLCENVCPANNIRIDDSVVFGNKCENCFACANLCPEHAVHSNNAMLKRRQYRNPIISVNDIIKANKHL